MSDVQETYENGLDDHAPIDPFHRPYLEDPIMVSSPASLVWKSFDA